jgi:hypothetical protein
VTDFPHQPTPVLLLYRISLRISWAAIAQLGAEGWEMCGSYTVNFPDGFGQQFYFKPSQPTVTKKGLAETKNTG